MMKNKLERIRQMLIEASIDNGRSDPYLIDKLLTEHFTEWFNGYTEADLTEAAEYHFGIDLENEEIK